jgi:hypothetical protein
MSDCQQAQRHGLGWLTNRGLSVCATISIGLWCGGVELEGSGATKVKVMRVRADGPRAVKGGCWAWTEGLEKLGGQLQ